MKVNPPSIEQSKLISKLLPADISIVAPSKENNFVLFGSEGSNEVWGYSYYNTTDKRIQSAWFKWTLSGTLVSIVYLKMRTRLSLKTVTITR